MAGERKERRKLIMNKLFTKIAALSVGLAMAIGVGVAVASNSKEATPVHAVTTRYTLDTSSTTIASGNSYGSYSESSTAYKWAITCGSKQTNSPAGLWLGSNNNQKAKMILSTGSLSDASGIATAISVTTSATYYAAIIQTASTIANVDTVTVSYNSTAGTAPSEAWVLYNDGTNGWQVFQKVTSLSTSGTDFTHAQVASARYAFVIHSTGYCQFKVPVLAFKGTDATTQTIEASNESPYSDESVTLTTNATSATWSVTSGGSYGHLSSTSGKSVSLVGDAAGSVTVKAVASGYTDATKTITFTERPSSPFITPAKASTSGYTGQNETLSFTYGNLTSTLGVSSSNTSVVTVGTPSASAGSGTVQINFVGAGSTTVKFKDGSTELASVSVSVTASSVTITGLPASKSIANGGTFNLGSLITVTATGSYSSDVTWESDDDSIVSVTSSGVITGESVGTTGVTVTSDDYPSATMTCSVTVANMISAVFGSGTNDGTAAESDSDNLINNYGYTVDSNIYFPSLSYVYPKADNAVKLGGSSTQGSMTIGLVDGKVSSKNAYITKITVNAMAYGTDSTSITINGSSKTLTSSFADYDVDVTGTSTTSIVIEASAASKQRFRIQYINVFYANPVELSSVTTSGQTTLFTAGNKWSYGGTLTAHYSDSSSAAKTPTSFKYGASGINPTTAGTTITADTTLNHDTHNGKYIYVVYTENDITKWASYQITVNAAPATSVTLSSNSSSVAIEEVFDVTTVTATVNPSAYATQDVTWEVFDSDGLVEDDTYMFDGTEFYATEPAEVVFHVKANSNSSIYATYTLTISGDPIVRLEDDSHNDLTNGSTSVFADAGDIYFEVTAENFEGTITYTWTSSNTSVISINDGENTSACMFSVEAAGSARLSCRVVGSTKGDVTVYVDVTVSAVTVTSVTWNAPTINVYSGATLSTAGWNVRYSTNSGKTDQTPDSFDILLGGSVISNGYAFAAADDGKTLAVRVGGTTSATTTTVSVTQTLRPINADITSNSVSTLTFEDKYATAGATADDGKEWTVTSDGTESTYDSNKGIHYGTSSAAVQYIKANSSDFTSGKITKVVVNASTASGVSATVGVKINGVQFGGDPKSLSSSAEEYTFTGEVNAASIEVEVTKASSATKAIYLKSIAVTTTTSSGAQNIANVAGHEAAQKAVVKFAKAFNAAMDTTSMCTTNMSSAWSTASGAWTTFNSDISSLSEAEQTYAKNLIKYATAQWTKNTDSDYSYCLERAMATYEYCVANHGMNAFMSTVRPVEAIRFNPISLIVADSKSANTAAIIIVISAVSIAAVGGYFFLRKKKED